MNSTTVITLGKSVAMDQLMDDTKKLTKDTGYNETYWRRNQDPFFEAACTLYEKY